MNNAPEWWRKAKELEREDRLEEAEEVIKQAMLPQGYPWHAQFAELYKERMERLLDGGRKDEAKVAAEKAANWMWAYASGRPPEAKARRCMRSATSLSVN